MDASYWFTCPECLRGLRVPATAVGQSGRCVHCGATVVAPEVPVDAEVAGAASAGALSLPPPLPLQSPQPPIVAGGAWRPRRAVLIAAGAGTFFVLAGLVVVSFFVGRSFSAPGHADAPLATAVSATASAPLPHPAAVGAAAAAHPMPATRPASVQPRYTTVYVPHRTASSSSGLTASPATRPATRPAEKLLAGRFAKSGTRAGGADATRRSTPGAAETPAALAARLRNNPGIPGPGSENPEGTIGLLESIDVMTNFQGGKPRPARAGRALPDGAAGDAVVAQLVQAMKDPDKSDSTRMAAAKEVSAFGPRAADAVPLILEFTRSRDAQTRRAALACLAKIGKPSVPALIDLIRNAGQPPANLDQMDPWDAVDALGTIGPDAHVAVPLIFGGLRTFSPNSGYAAYTHGLEAIRRIKPDPAVAAPQLRALLSGKVAGLNTKMYSNVSYFWDNDVELIVNMLGDAGPGAKDAVPELLALLNTPKCDWKDRVAGINALGKIGPGAAAALPTLRGYLRGGAQWGTDGDYARAAEKAIESIKGP